MKLFTKRIIYFFPMFFSICAHANFTASSSRVIDGDTLDVVKTGFSSKQGGHEIVRIRLAGIDAPESKQAFGQDAKQRLSELVASRVLNIREDSKDRYGRTIAFVIACKGNHMNDTENCSSVNYTLVSEGLAWAYRYQNRPTDRVAARLEASAKQARYGLWGSNFPVEPWRWRRLHR